MPAASADLHRVLTKVRAANRISTTRTLTWILLFVAAATAGLVSEATANLHPTRPSFEAVPAAPSVVMVSHPRVRSTDYQAGVNLLIYDNDPSVLPKARRILDHLAGLGANSIEIVFPFYQDSWRADTLHSDPLLTPTVDTLRVVIDEAHRRHFTVMLRPLLDELSLHPAGQWRGGIRPVQVSTWFSSYSTFLTPYLQLAQAEQVESFDIGSEFESLQVWTTSWRRLIAAARRIYRGQIAYSMNWTSPYPAFASVLDFVGIDAFYPLRAPMNATPDQISVAWRRWLPGIRHASLILKKPIVFTEIGTNSQPASYQQPFRWAVGGATDLNAQAVYYRGSCQAVQSSVAGLYWWEVELDPRAHPNLDPTYNFGGKPAEQQIAACFLPAPARQTKLQ